MDASPGTGLERVGADDLVTGDAVAVTLPTAGLGLRVLSGLIDVIARLVALAAISALLAARFDGLDGALTPAVVLCAVVGVLVVWPAVLETVTDGRTAGKWITGLRTVRSDGGPADARRFLARHLVGFVEIYALAGAPAAVAGAATARSLRVGDLVAGTVVARDRRRLALPDPLTMPPALARWAATADVAPLPPGLAARLRHVLREGGEYTPQARERLHADLLDRVLAHVSPPPPAAPPHEVLRAVLVRRRDLDAARLERERRLRERLFAGAR